MIKDLTPQQKISFDIVEHLGGFANITVMINARNYDTLEPDPENQIKGGIKFNFSGTRKYNLAVIKLTDSGRYTLELWKISPQKRFNPQRKYRLTMLPECLKEMFCRETGLDLFPMGGK